MDGDKVKVYVIEAPTCQKEGIGEYRCIHYDICHGTKRVVLDKVEHSFDKTNLETREKVKGANCQENSYYRYQCIYGCGHYLQENGQEYHEIIPDEYGDHDYDFHVCKICGHIEEADFEMEVGATSVDKVKAYFYQVDGGYEMLVYGYGTESNEGHIKSCSQDEYYGNNNVNETPWYDYIKQLTSVKFMGNITELPNGGFYDAIKLKSLIIESKVTTIPKRFCRGDYNLEQLILPDTISKVGQYAFGNCVKIKVFDFSTCSQSLKFEAGAFTVAYPKLIVLPSSNSLTDTTGNVIKDLVGSIAAVPYKKVLNANIVILDSYPQDIDFEKNYMVRTTLYFVGKLENYQTIDDIIFTDEYGVQYIKANDATIVAECPAVPYTPGKYISYSEDYICESVNEYKSGAVYANGGDGEKITTAIWKYGFKINTIGESYIIYSAKSDITDDELNNSINEHSNIIAISDLAFACNETLTTINIPDSCEYIGIGAFSNLGYYFSKTDIKEGTLIEETSFSAINITVNSKLKAIGKFAFNGCKNITEINNIPATCYIGLMAKNYQDL